MTTVSLKGAKGGSGSFTQTPDNLRSNDTFEGVLGLCVGPIKGPVNGLKSVKLDGTAIENESGDQNFTDFVATIGNGDPAQFPQPIQLKLGAGGTPTQVGTPISNTPLTAGGSVSGPGVWTTKTINNTNADFIDLRFVVNALYRQDSKGIYDTTATLDIQLKPSGSSTWIDPTIGGSSPPPASTDVTENPIEDGLGGFTYVPTGYRSQEYGRTSYPITGKTTSPAVYELRIALPNTGAYANTPWDVRVRLEERDSFDDGNGNQEKRSITWESIEAVYGSVLGTEPDWQGVAWMQLYGKASDQLTGVPEVTSECDTKIVSVPPTSVFDPNLRQYTTNLWDGSWTKAYTNDPAWVINDAISDSLSGLSLIARGSYLNKWDALDASKWCSTPVPDGNGGMQPRYCLNLAVTETQKAEDFIRYLAGSFGGLAWDQGDGQWRLRVDKPESAVDLFTLDNIEGEFTYANTDVDTRFNDITGTFLNADMDYRQDRVRLYDNPSIALLGQKPTTIALVGCTDRQEALRRVKLRLRSAVNENRIVNFTTNRRGRNINPLDLILISDGDLANTNQQTHGRMSLDGTNTQKIVFRDPIYLPSGTSYTLEYTLPNPNYNPDATSQPGADWTKPTLVQTVNIGTNSANFDQSVYTLYIDSSTPLPSTLPPLTSFAINAPNLPSIPKLFRVTNINVGDDGERIAISALEVDQGKWDAADNVSNIDTVFQDLRGPVPSPLPPIDGNLLAIVKIPVGQGYQTSLVANWIRPTGAFISGFDVKYRINGGAWQNPQTNLQQATFELVDPTAGAYEFAISTIDRRGGMSDPLSGFMNVTQDILNAAQIYYTDNTGVPTASSIQSLKPAQAGADVTGQNTAQDTNNVNGIPAATLVAAVNATAPLLDQTAPPIPTGLALNSTLSLDTDGSQIVTLKATWTAVTGSKNPLASYVLALSTNGGSYIEFPLGVQSTTYTTLIGANTTVSAKIRATDANNNTSGYSPVVSTTTIKDTTPPAAPTALASTASITGTFLTWTNPADADTATVEVWEGTVNDVTKATKVTTVSAKPSQQGGASRVGLISGATYYYWVRALDTSGNASGYSSSTSVTVRSVGNNDMLGGLQVPSNVSSLPSASGYTGPSLVFNQADGKLYRYSNGAFTAAVATGDLSGQITGSQIVSNLVSISSSGQLTGNGSGQVTIGGLGYTGALNATKNAVSSQNTAPSSPTNGDIWNDTSTTPATVKMYVGGTWVVASNLVTNTNQVTDGANLGGTAAWTGVSARPANIASLSGSESILNSGISIAANGTLSGGGGGQVTIGGLGYTGALNATKNAVSSGSSAPGSPSNGDVWNDTSTNPATTKLYVNGAWIIASNLVTNTTQVTDGANLGGTAAWSGVSARPANLSALSGSEAIQNSSISINANGSLTGAGSGSVTIGGLGYTGALNATKNTVTSGSTAPSSPTNGDVWNDTSTTPATTKLYVSGAWTVASNLVTNTNQVTDGANLGQTAAWGSVSARPANVASLSGSESILNSGITINANGTLAGAGSGQVTIGGLGYTGALNATKNAVSSGSSAPSLPTNGDVWNDTSTNPATTKLYVNGTWVVSSTFVTNTNQVADGANLGQTAAWGSVSTRPANLSALTGSETIQNSLVTINSSGQLTGIGSGAGTLVSNSLLSLSASGALQGGSGGSITALPGTSIAAASITANQIASATITGSLIAANTITAANIAANTITAGQIAAGTITSTQIATGAITIGSNGQLGGAGTGQVTIGGLGYAGALNATADMKLTPIGTATITGNVIKSNTSTDGGDGGKTVERVLGACVAGCIVQSLGTYMQIVGSGGQAYEFNLGGDGNIRCYTAQGNTGYTVVGSAAVGDSIALIQDETKVQLVKNGSVIYTRSDVPTRQQSWQAVFSCYSYATIGGVYFRAYTDNAWASVGGTGRPADNATVGAPAGTLVGSTSSTTIESRSNDPGAWINTGNTTTINGGRITTGSVTASQIAASTITGNLIAGNTIQGASLVAGTITGDRISAGTITGSLIAAATITGDRMVANTITATQIASATITGNLIAANTLVANNIAAGAITTSKLSVISDNLFGDPTFQDPNFMTTANPTGKGTGGLGVAGSWYYSLSADNPFYAGGLGSYRIDQTYTGTSGSNLTSPWQGGVAWNTNYSIAGVLYNSTNQVLQFRIQFGDVNGNVIDDQLVFSVAAGDTSTALRSGQNITGNNKAVMYRLYILCPAGPITGPTGGSAGIAVTGNWQLRKANDTTMYVAGTIAATALVANSITANQIQAGTITAAQIASRTIQANNLVSGTITANEIATGTITANNIAAGTITGTQISTTTSLPGTITIGGTGVTIATIQSQSANPAAVVNANSTLINAGSISIQGATTLISLLYGGDNTKINGGAIASNTVTANKLTIGNRNLNFPGLTFQVVNGYGAVQWPNCYAQWVDANGNPQQVSLGGATQTLGSGYWYFYWTEGATGIQSTTNSAIATQPGYVCLATWQSGTALLVQNYGGTIIDGSMITTNSITASQIAANTITATQIASNTITGNLIAANSITADKLQIGSTSGARTQIAPNLITVYDSNNTLRVRLGVF